jgi:hypothetical protein
MASLGETEKEPSMKRKIPSVKRMNAFVKENEVRHETDVERVLRGVATRICREYTGHNTIHTWYRSLRDETTQAVKRALEAKGWNVEVYEDGDLRDGYFTNFKISAPKATQ